MKKIDRILKYIEENPFKSCRQIADEFGHTYESMRQRYILKLHDDGKIHVASHTQTNPKVGLYCVGPGLPRKTRPTRKSKPMEYSVKVRIKVPPTDPLTAFALGLQ